MNIKDFLHLYLGCNCTADGKEFKLHGVEITDTGTLAYDGTMIDGIHQCWWVENCEFKIILRPLSEMSIEEADHFAWLCLNSRHAPKDFIHIEKDEIDINLVPNDGGLMLDNDVEVYIGISCRCLDGYIAIMKDGRIGMADEEDTPAKEMKPVDDVYGKVKYLLACGFDLFGLIEAGLAIDKNYELMGTPGRD